MSALVENLIAVIVGWALGFGSGWLIEWNRERKKCVAIQRAIRTELLDVGYRLVATVFVIYDRKGTLLNRKILEWVLSYTELYAGPNHLRGEITIFFFSFNHAPHQLKLLLAIILLSQNDIKYISS